MEYIEMLDKYFYIVALIILLIMMSKTIYNIGLYLSIRMGLNKKTFTIRLKGIEYYIDPTSDKYIVEQIEEQDKLRNRGNVNE